MAQQPVSGSGSLHYRGFKITLRHTTLDRLLWTSDQPDAETSTLQHTTLTTEIHVHGGIRPAVTEIELQQTHAEDRAATGIDGLSL